MSYIELVLDGRTYETELTVELKQLVNIINKHINHEENHVKFLPITEEIEESYVINDFCGFEYLDSERAEDLLQEFLFKQSGSKSIKEKMAILPFKLN